MTDKQTGAICISVMWCTWLLVVGAIEYGESTHETANATNCVQTEARR